MGRQMILRVGAFLYRVNFVEGYIDHQGQQCLGLCDNDAHEITDSTVPGLAQQVQVICHEYMEAWLFHFGQGVSDKEDYCDLFGIAMAQFVLDLTHQLHTFAAGEDQLADSLDAIRQMGQRSQVPPGKEQGKRQNVATKVVDARVHGLAAGSGQPTPPPRPTRSEAEDGTVSIASELARQAAKAGLSVARIYDP